MGGEGAFEGGFDIGGFAARLVRPGEAHELFADVGPAPAHAQDRVGKLPAPLFGVVLREQLGRQHDGGEDVVEVVGDTGGELPDCGEADGVLGAAQIGDVAHGRQIVRLAV